MLAENNTSMLKWEAIYLNRHVLILSLDVIELKSHRKKKKKEKKKGLQSRYGRVSTF